jgi:hypothetical protein
MVRRLIMAVAVLASTSGCATVIGGATLDYVHSPNNLPPPGRVFIAQGRYFGAAILNEDAYAWFRLFGYEQAASADQADYFATLDVTTKSGTCLQNQTVPGDPIFTKDGRTVVPRVETGKCDIVNYDVTVHLVVRSTRAPAVPAMVEIEATGTGVTGNTFNAAIELDATRFARLVVELVFTDFPGIQGREQHIFLTQSGNRVCAHTTVWNTRPIDHCRAFDAPPGVLTGTSSS